MRTHYPRTPHLPWSPGFTPDDLRAAAPSGPAALAGREVVVTEKLDGENTTLYRDGLHARSLDSGHHPSRAWVKALQGRIGPGIPPGWRVCGENLYARHSLAYTGLDSYFYGFSVWDADGRCLPWDDTVHFLGRLGVPVPRVLWRGTYDERALRRLRLDTGRQEGFVVRAVEGFGAEEFALRVAKWVRPGHVQTGTHWMHAAVVENGLGPAAPLWAVRSGAAPEPGALLGALGYDGGQGPDERTSEAVREAAGRLDVLGRTGDARLAGVLATLLHEAPRAALFPGLRPVLGLPLARRVADLTGLHRLLHAPFPDEERRAGLIRLAAATDPGVLHAVAAAVPAGAAALEQAEWSALYAQEAGLLAEDPLGPLREGLRTALAGAGVGSAAADRCWARAREAYAQGRIGGVEEAVAATWPLRAEPFPRLLHLVGPAGSGKSTLAAAVPGARCVSLDALRAARGDRSDQSANPAVLRAGLALLDAELATGGTVVWDATSLTERQREPVLAAAARRSALVTQVVSVVGEDELVRRNDARTHRLPAGALERQLRRYSPPYPGRAHRIRYAGPDGGIEDRAGGLADGGPWEVPAAVAGPGPEQWGVKD
ncbi:RNA ligase family protein [Streptomyces sp. NPDC089919]|uniref:RNA ligase family protein n=1 Tax=Streptomyces sp. NPDC089919 TaxID=3155188 RepID=UPI0034355EC3